ncbi:GNAT family N-acetyltransferase [Lacticaseibacillus saniviri]
MQINIRPITTSDLSDFWQLAFSRQDAEWRQWNGPYFHDELPTQAAFMANADQWVNQPFRWLVTADDTMVGMVSAYYEDGALQRWLDVGIIIYRDHLWGQHIGQRALTAWIDHLFEVVALPHIGLTTWSGNQRMMALSQRIGMREEARVRQVRYWQGHYYDSVKYGVLRDEWLALRKE